MCVLTESTRDTRDVSKALGQFDDFNLEEHQNSIPTRSRRFSENAVEGSDMTNFSDDPVANSRCKTLER